MRLKLVFSRENVSAVGSTAKRENMRVLKKKKLFRPLTRTNPLDGFFLKCEPVGIANVPQPSGFANWTETMHL
jgi:hypothetical protein